MARRLRQNDSFPQIPINGPTNRFGGDEFFSRRQIFFAATNLEATNLFRSDESLFLATNLRGGDLVSRRQSYLRGTIFKGGRLLKCLVSRKITTPFFPHTIEVKGQLARKEAGPWIRIGFSGMAEHARVCLTLDLEREREAGNRFVWRDG